MVLLRKLKFHLLSNLISCGPPSYLIRLEQVDVNILPCMVCGTNQLGLDTAEKMKTARLVIWSQHGLSGMGNTLDEAFGLIETVEKAAEVYMKIAGLPRVNTISDEILRGLAERFGLTPKEGYLS